MLRDDGSNEVAANISNIKSCKGDLRASDIKYQVMQKYDAFEHLTVPRIFSEISPAHIEIVKAGPYDGVLRVSMRANTTKSRVHTVVTHTGWTGSFIPKGKFPYLK